MDEKKQESERERAERELEEARADLARAQAKLNASKARGRHADEELDRAIETMAESVLEGWDAVSTREGMTAFATTVNARLSVLSKKLSPETLAKLRSRICATDKGLAKALDNA
jgi:molecular chaperone GrpE (heat shock protein)